MSNTVGTSLLLLSIGIILSGCTTKNVKSNQTTNPVQPVLTDTFTDSLFTGKPQRNKIELLKYSKSATNESYIVIKLFDREENKWRLTYCDTVPSDNFARLSPEVRDYTMDGLGDLKFCLNIGANLANAEFIAFTFSSNPSTFKVMGKGWNLTYSNQLKMFRERYVTSTIYATYYQVKRDTLLKAYDVDLGAVSESIIQYDENGRIIKSDSSILEKESENLPNVKHWLREWTLRDTLD